MFRQSIQDLVNNELGARSVIDGDTCDDVPTTNFTRANSVSASRKDSHDVSVAYSRGDEDMK